MTAPNVDLVASVNQNKKTGAKEDRQVPWYRVPRYRFLVGGVALVVMLMIILLSLWGAGIFNKGNVGSIKSTRIDNEVGKRDSVPGTSEPTNRLKTKKDEKATTRDNPITTTPTVVKKKNVGAPGYRYTYNYPPGVNTKNIQSDYAYVEKAFFTPWTEWKEKCGNGKCEEGEWCKTCPQDCPCTGTCGNKLCEDSENGDTCPEDCTHNLSFCGNGKCENHAGPHEHWIYRYETEYNCPQDCHLEERCGDGKCGLSETCWTCSQDCNVCPTVCGDGRCSPGETCKSCRRDCGYCDEIVNDWRKMLQGTFTQTKAMNKYTHNGVEYATIDNTKPREQSYVDRDCSAKGKVMPRGWMLAVYNGNAESLLKTNKIGFETGCAVFYEGVSRPMNNGVEKNDCEDNFIYVQPRNDGNDYFNISKDYCPSRILIQSVVSTVKNKDKFTLLLCPFDCSQHGVCNPYHGVCICSGRWTGPGCERVIGDLTVPSSTHTWYKPKKGIKWQWQLQEKIDMSFDVPLYDIDFDNKASVIKKLHGQGRKVMCYFSAGSWEKFRTDQKLFLQEYMGAVLSFGEGDDFPDERWLDIRRLDTFAMLMLDRIDLAKQKGCDAIEFDNPDSIVHDNGVKNGDKNGSVTLNMQLIYNKWLVAQSHARGLAVALKNANEFASYLYQTYDMVVNEECWVNGNCGNYWPFIQADKPVLNCEYFTARCMYCPRSLKMGFSTIKKEPPLNACRVDCTTKWNNEPCIAANWPFKPPKGNWCKTSENKLPDECPHKRFAKCDPNIGY